MREVGRGDLSISILQSSRLFRTAFMILYLEMRYSAISIDAPSNLLAKGVAIEKYVYKLEWILDL